ncbi:MAG: beta-ketoacyl-[acyl-carrier-protein] synthase family protein [Deltaproteobacteria bacterium]|nr:beta-ketoacyl-[acyl-carrier-protein] synthase family protein [Deltaproteobacteria bacterium]MBW2116743.1 beta-ketoacyl-[acyl-carrier-protein] synthase family protein [Deltaproteobacteria bacterium]MBW2343972.1 beta-ketoacyl-[acyl-carrier-protein] synthase family protein [Deltaproteobacteria bacterium]
MTVVRVYITGMGLITPVGRGVSETRASIKAGKKGFRPIGLFPVPRENPLPVGEISGSFETAGIPRTHRLALIAAKEAMADSGDGPDAIVLGVTTGGLATTEKLLKRGDRSPELYRYHATGSVAEYLAREFECPGTVITVSTACSSGSAAVNVALEMLRAGKAKKVLAGGADCLCRLTYYGFNSLQLVDPSGARPLDVNRRGMTVSEGAAMLVLEGHGEPPGNAIAEILGAGLSCDAYHPASPDPEGTGALDAMRAAVKNAGISTSDIDYVNLHGTGTIDNDLSEARALNRLFPDKKPLLSSIKGAFGHSLAAAGAIEAVVSAITISEGLVPANTGCDIPDPKLGLNPVREPIEAEIQTVLSNSLGFGGNNASLIIGRPGNERSPVSSKRASHLYVAGSACITGSGDTDKTLTRILKGLSCKGTLPQEEISRDLPGRTVRRLKRLPRMALSLAIASHNNSGLSCKPSSVFFGTGWGPLSETYDFLTRLYETEEQFASPIDFIGSVHNAPAAQVAIWFKSTGPNITTTGGDYSFEQSLMAASLLRREPNETILVVGADEAHETLSGLVDGSVLIDDGLSDGGGALCLKRAKTPSGLRVSPSFFENARNNPSVISSLIKDLGGPERINDKYGLVLAGIPGAYGETGNRQLDQFLSGSGFKAPVIDYRKFTGQFASASAVAAVLAIRLAQGREIPKEFCGKEAVDIHGKGILIIGLGNFVTAVEILNSGV